MYTVTGCLCHNACGVAMSVATTMTTMTRDENEQNCAPPVSPSSEHFNTQ